MAQDNQQAIVWYQKAAEQGDAKAQFSLGAIYHAGKKVPKNVAQAYARFSVAATNGYEEGATLRDEITTRLTPAELTEGQRLAAQYIAAYHQK
ncbi:MAG: hypothetical protein ACRC6F_03880 [Aeromonas sp.]